MCIEPEDFLVGLILIAIVGVLLGWLWDSLFTHPEDN